MIEHIQGKAGALELFRESKRYRQMETRYRELSQDPYVDHTRLRRDFSGALFEHLAFSHLETLMPDSHMLLDPGETFNYYHTILYPSHQISDHSFTTTLYGVSVPDAILIGNKSNKPVGIFETTLSKNPGVFAQKFMAYLKNRALFPRLFSKAKLAYVVPKVSESVLRDISSAVDPEETTFLTLPYTHEEFRRFKGELLAHAQGQTVYTE